MTPLTYVLLAAATSTPASTPRVPVPSDFAPKYASIEIVQVRIRQRMIVRVPAMANMALPVPLPRLPTTWREKRGPSCIAMTALAGAAVTQADAVDLYLRGGQRLRARLDKDCPALDYYHGFYVVPAKDGQICADRDVIRTRSGGQCEIMKFRKLVPGK